MAQPSPVTGQRVRVHVTWDATGFAATANYVLRVTLDGVPLDLALTNLGNGTHARSNERERVERCSWPFDDCDIDVRPAVLAGREHHA